MISDLLLLMYLLPPAALKTPLHVLIIIVNFLVILVFGPATKNRTWKSDLEGLCYVHLTMAST